MAKHKLSKVDVLKYALLGVRNEIGHNTGNPWMDTEEMEEMEADEDEIERRLKLATLYEKRRAEGHG